MKSLGTGSLATFMEPYPVKKPPTLRDYGQAGKIPCTFTNGRCQIPMEFAENALAWRKNTLSVEDMLSENATYQALPLSDKKDCVRAFYYQVPRRSRLFLTEDSSPYILLFQGQFIAPGREDEVRQSIQEIIAKYEATSTGKPVSTLAEEAGISVYRMKKFLADNGIPTHIGRDNETYADPDAVQELIGKQNGMVGIYDVLRTIDIPATLFDITNGRDRVKLYSSLKNGKYSALFVLWSDMKFHGDRRNAFYFPLNVKIRSKQR